jgi:PadR family transcriptional regulator, regulatory protein AphA
MQYCQEVPPTPTHTSYAVLGLLSVRSWTAYELARQSERSLRWFFPRAERAVYLEVKRLVDLRWARARTSSTGRRASTVYTITAAGTAALRKWLREPSTPTEIVSEPALKLFFADQGGTEEMRATVDGIRADAAHALDQLAGMAGHESEFPERMATNVLSMRLIADLHRTILEWTDWAQSSVDVLASGDQDKIDQQTRDALQTIRSAARR